MSEPLRRQQGRSEDGQATVIIVGFALVLLLAAAVVVDASAAFLQRQGLDTVADGAALAGADAGSADLATLYTEGVPDAGRLDQAEAVARAAVGDHLRRTGAVAAYPGLRYSVAVDPVSREVRVQVRAPADLPFHVPGGPSTAVVGATGSATVQVDQAAP